MTNVLRGEKRDQMQARPRCRRRRCGGSRAVSRPFKRKCRLAGAESPGGGSQFRSRCADLATCFTPTVALPFGFAAQKASIPRAPTTHRVVPRRTSSGSLASSTVRTTTVEPNRLRAFATRSESCGERDDGICRIACVNVSSCDCGSLARSGSVAARARPKKIGHGPIETVGMILNTEPREGRRRSVVGKELRVREVRKPPSE